MNIKDQLTQALKEAMKAQDTLTKRTVRMALAAIKNAEIEQKGAIAESAVLAILQKEVKSRLETIEGAEKAGRQDLIAEAQAEMAILETYLPQPFTPEELEKLVRAAIAESGATSPREMGKVMQILMPQVQGKADGKEVSALVRQLLN